MANSDDRIELRHSAYLGDSDVEVFVNGEYTGTVERMADGTWDADITAGNGPPTRGFATVGRAIDYVINPSDDRRNA